MVGIVATIPAKIRIDTPFPIPYSVTSSPIHMRSIEPATTRITLVIKPKVSSPAITPWFWSRVRKPKAWRIANGSVSIRLYCMNFCLPASPSSVCILLRAGDITVINCMMIDAVMYGPTPNITIDRLANPPPEKMLRSPKNWLLLKNSWSTNISTPGIGIEARARNTIRAPNTKRIRLRILSSLIIIFSLWMNVSIQVRFFRNYVQCLYKASIVAQNRVGCERLGHTSACFFNLVLSCLRNHTIGND